MDKTFVSVKKNKKETNAWHEISWRVTAAGWLGMGGQKDG
jgi:hypothetical protein